MVIVKDKYVYLIKDHDINFYKKLFVISPKVYTISQDGWHAYYYWFSNDKEYVPEIYHKRDSYNVLVDGYKTVDSPDRVIVSLVKNLKEPASTTTSTIYLSVDENFSPSDLNKMYTDEEMIRLI